MDMRTNTECQVPTKAALSQVNDDGASVFDTEIIMRVCHRQEGGLLQHPTEHSVKYLEPCYPATPR